MGNLQSVLEEKNNSLSFRQYDKDLPIIIKKIEIIYSKKSEDQKYIISIEKENELKLLLENSEFLFSKKSVNFQNTKFHLANYLSTFAQTAKVKKIPKKIPKDVYIAIDEIDFTFKFTIQIKTDKASKMRTFAFCNVGSIMDLNDLLITKLKECPNIQQSLNFSIVNFNLIENKKNSNIYEWQWKYSPPPNPKDAAYPGNGGWRNICCFVEYDINSNEFLFHKGFKFWTICLAPNSAIPNSTSMPVSLRDGIYRNHSICIGGSNNIPTIQLQSESGTKKEENKIYQIQSTRTSISSYKIRDSSIYTFDETEKNNSGKESEFSPITKHSSFAGLKKPNNAQLSLDVNVNRNNDIYSAQNSIYTSSNFFSSFTSPSVINIQNINSLNQNDTNLLAPPSSIPNGPSNDSESIKDFNYEELMFDGPVFRDTINELEKKTLKIKNSLKDVIKKAEEYMIAAEEANNMYKNLMDSMYDIPIFNTMIKNYIRISKNNESQLNEDFLSQLQNLVITPLNDTYKNDFELLETKKKDFEQESNEYYSMLSKYLSCKYDEHPKKKAELDSKLGDKKRKFDLNRYDYLIDLQELSEGENISFAVNTFLTKQFYHHDQLRNKFYDKKDELKNLDKYMTALTKSKHVMSKERQEKRKTYENIDELSKNDNQNSKFKGIRDLYHINYSDDESTQTDEIKVMITIK
ncbi:hypothetical protein LY90DRAFT_666635 [Neocallimastix californiae]|uniref:BAR domain-containing protein n=1 Tax=Neocallimastix californiae TaxID=1754190 RepID=A0A1Y2EPS4_9FUNG|nr:hypothetical protein LY90DRAFT_666635 [Neocallimastix californiae]|eukprot:ORY73549.1 hypothetical protein LY90DRAFT_666635 [Neocallimastix californiae]